MYLDEALDAVLKKMNISTTITWSTRTISTPRFVTPSNNISCSEGCGALIAVIGETNST